MAGGVEITWSLRSLPTQAMILSACFPLTSKSFIRFSAVSSTTSVLIRKGLLLGICKSQTSVSCYSLQLKLVGNLRRQPSTDEISDYTDLLNQCHTESIPELFSLRRWKQGEIARILASRAIFPTGNRYREPEYVFLKYNKSIQLICISQYQFLNFHWDTTNSTLQAY